VSVSDRPIEKRLRRARRVLIVGHWRARWTRAARVECESVEKCAVDGECPRGLGLARVTA
jgi:hypothetical protein